MEPHNERSSRSESETEEGAMPDLLKEDFLFEI